MNICLDESRNNFNDFIKDVFTQPKLEEAFGAEVNQVLPTQNLGIFSYKIDVVNGSWVLWKDVSLPKISGNEVGH